MNDNYLKLWTKIFTVIFVHTLKYKKDMKKEY